MTIEGNNLRNNHILKAWYSHCGSTCFQEHWDHDEIRLGMSITEMVGWAWVMPIIVITSLTYPSTMSCCIVYNVLHSRWRCLQKITINYSLIWKQTNIHPHLKILNYKFSFLLLRKHTIILINVCKEHYNDTAIEWCLGDIGGGTC